MAEHQNLQGLEGILIGKDGGKTFAIQGVKTLQIRSGDRVDAIIINGTLHGRANDGSLSKIIEFDVDEYINSLHFRQGSLIDYLSFTTNKGKVLSGGGSGGNAGTISGKIYAIGGMSGENLDAIQVVGLDMRQG